MQKEEILSEEDGSPETPHSTPHSTPAVRQDPHDNWKNVWPLVTFTGEKLIYSHSSALNLKEHSLLW